MGSQSNQSAGVEGAQPSFEEVGFWECG